MTRSHGRYILRFLRLLMPCLVSISFVLIGSGNTSVAAATDAGPPAGAVTLSPFLANVQLNPDEATKDVQFTLLNTTNQTENFTPAAVNFGTLDQTGGLAFAGGNIKEFTSKYGLVDWLQLTPEQVSIPPGQAATITATIRNDATLGPGGHYAAIIMTLNNDQNGQSDTVNVQQKVSALLFATKTGGEVYDMHLASVLHDGSWHQLPAIFTLLFKNTGNVDVVPRGTIRVLAPGGRAVSEGTINEASAYVLPETNRQMAVQTHAVGAAAWLPAKYVIQIDYRYDGHPTFATQKYYITYWNLPHLLALIAVLALVVYGVVVLSRNRQKLKIKPLKHRSKS